MIDETRILGPYLLQERVGRGGMGEIWRATDTRSGATVAVKRVFIPGGSDHAGEVGARLMREIQALKQVGHRHVVRFLDAGFDPARQPYLVLEWLEGRDLARCQREAPLELAVALDVARQALDGLAACHARGIVHRDVKPANLFLVPHDGGWQIKVLDLGLALVADDATRMTVAGTVMGTLHYMSPEQARGAADVDARADIYAMGVVLYELCTGRLPFDAEQPVAVLLKIVTETPARPRQIRPELPRWLEDAILEAMQRAPSERFASAEQMRAALDQPLSQLPSSVALSPLAVMDADTVAAMAPVSSLEHRLVTLLCVEAVDETFNFSVPTSAAIEREDGLFYRVLGGQMVGLFGLERTHGDEGLRAVRAGLSVAKHAHGNARMLAATVHVEVREGLRLRAEDLDQMIATLRGLPPGSLVVDAPTRQLVGRHVELERVGTHDAVVAVVDQASVRRQVLGSETPTLGRETELAAIRAAFHRTADNGEAESVLLLGPAGIGKSRLLEELLPALRERCTLCLHARADSGKAKTPYALLADAILRLAGVSLGVAGEEQRAALFRFVARFAPAEQAQATAAFLGEVAGVRFEPTPTLVMARDDPKVMRERVSAAFEAVLVGATERGPVALCLEDLHRADEESLNLCEALLERLEERALFVLGTARAELLERRPAIFEEAEASRIALQPLGRRPLRRLVRAILRQPASKELEGVVARWADGNPYFVEELLSWLAAHEAIVLRPSGWELMQSPETLELPAGVEGAIQGRLDRLEAAQKEVLKAAAVFGDVFWLEGCEALGIDGAAKHLDDLSAAHLVVAQDETRIAGAREFSFRHTPVRQVAYRMQPAETRRTAHAKAARFLEERGETDAALLAHHFEQGGERQRAGDYFARAGARSLADGDLPGAVEHYRASLRGEVVAHVRQERALSLGQALLLMGRYDEAEETVKSTSDGAAQPELRVEFFLGRIAYGRGENAKAEVLLMSAWQRLGPQDEPLRFGIQRTLFWVRFSLGQYRRANEVAEQLSQLAEGDRRLDHLCEAKLALAYCHAVVGDAARSIVLAERAVEHAVEAGHAYHEVAARTVLGSAREGVGQYAAAMQSLETALSLATRLNLAANKASIHLALGRLCAIAGDLPRALRHFDAAARQARRVGDQRTEAGALLEQANARQRLDSAELATVVEVAERALSLAAGLYPAVEAEAHVALARVFGRIDRPADALTHARAAVSLLDELGASEQSGIEILLTAYDALDAAGARDEATRILERAAATLHQQAARISDPAVRASYLDNVPANARLRALQLQHDGRRT